jgi:hypothetical protein
MFLFFCFFLNLIGLYSLAAALHGYTTYNYQECLTLVRNGLAFCFGLCFILYAFMESAALLRSILIGYFASDMLIMVHNPVFYTKTFMLHHTMAFLLIFYNMYSPRSDYYLFWLGGYGEVSTLPLCIVDAFRHVPALKQQFPAWNQYSRIAFTVSFLSIRVVGWSFVIMRCNEHYLVRCVLYSLLAMQYVWGGKLIRAVAKECFKR